MSKPILTNKVILYLSMGSLLLGGSIMIYEGVQYIKLKQSNPSISSKIYVAAILAIILGVAEIFFGIYHLFID